jgi:hypothetical protein
MSKRFGEAATRLSGQAALLIGWTPDTFWAAPPAGGGIDMATLTAMMEHDAHG